MSSSTAAGGPGGCLAANDWLCGEYLRTRQSELIDATVEHVWITASSIVIAIVIALPLAVAARRWRAARGPALGVTTVLYTIPSLAMFALLLPFFGLSAAVVVTGLVLYSLTVLVRNLLAGLDSVPDEATEAARGMGYGPGRLLFEVELPLALPAMLAGVRIATVTAVSLTTVGAIVGYGGLGNLIYDGMESFFKAQVLTASAICVVLAIVADVLLLCLQRALTPWTRAVKRERRGRGDPAARAAKDTGSGPEDGGGSGPGSGPDGGGSGGPIGGDRATGAPTTDSRAADGGTGRGGPFGLAGKTTG
ncbi:ABC transporter permease [Streptomyces axinellae]|uniref:ABC transporter permease n=1 Tax=Streptomyces axinellae TaxID=552788 RepID=UPI0031D46B6B